MQMRNPEELEAFRWADELVLLVYELTTKFPSEERYGLTSQIRRAAVSVSSNLVEGCSRESQVEFRRFVEMSLGSAMELAHQLSLARRVNLCAAKEVDLVEERAIRVRKMLVGLGKALRAETGAPRAFRGDGVVGTRNPKPETPSR